jgi:hypothetical protein
VPARADRDEDGRCVMDETTMIAIGLIAFTLLKYALYLSGA